MENLEFHISDDDILTIRCDLKKECGFTRYGRSVRVASSGGNCVLWKDGQPHPKKIRVNLNLFRPLTANEKDICR